MFRLLITSASVLFSLAPAHALTCFECNNNPLELFKLTPNCSDPLSTYTESKTCGGYYQQELVCLKTHVIIKWTMDNAQTMYDAPQGNQQAMYAAPQVMNIDIISRSCAPKYTLTPDGRKLSICQYYQEMYQQNNGMFGSITECLVCEDDNCNYW